MILTKKLNLPPERVPRHIAEFDVSMEYAAEFSEDLQKRLDNETGDREDLTKQKKALDQYILANKLVFNFIKKQRDKKVEKEQREQEKIKKIQDTLEQGKPLEKEIKTKNDIYKIFTSEDLKTLSEMGWDPIGGLKHFGTMDIKEQHNFLKRFKEFQEEKSQEIQERLDKNKIDDRERLTQQKKRFG